MKTIKRTVSVLLTFIMVFSMFTIVPMTKVGAASYTSSWRTWSQGASDYSLMRAYGCWVTAQAKMLKETGIASDSSFNPDRYMKWEQNNGHLNSGFYQINGTTAPVKYAKQQGKTLTYLGAKSASNTQLWSNINNGYYSIVKVHSYHYVYIDNDKSKTTGRIYFQESGPNSASYGSAILNTKYPSPLETYTYKYSTNSVPNLTYSAATGGASNISNTSAVISGSANASNGKWPYVSCWGFYYGTSNNPSAKKTVTWSNTYISSLSCNISTYTGNLNPGTTYYYKIWANIDGKEYTGSVNSFRTTAVKPGTATLKTSDTDIGLGDSSTVTWNSTSMTDSYTLKLFDSDGNVVESKAGVQGTNYSFKGIDTEGTYTATIYSVNSAGTTTGSSVNIVVHPDCIVKFVDINPEDGTETIVKEQTVTYGKSATAPENPSKTGYTFKSWNGTYTNVKTDVTVTSVYQINTYTVKFVNSYTGTVLSTQTVEYKKAATPPTYDLPKGYANVESGWDKDFSCITQDTTFYSVIAWGNPDIPMYIDNVVVTRFTDTETYKNEGYEVSIDLHNWDESLTTGRLIVALKTKEGKLLTETESSAFYLKTSATKTIEVYVPYKESVDYVEVYVVDQYSTAIPISESFKCSKIIVVGNTYDYSYNEAPAEGTYVEDSLTSYTEYRFKNKSTTTSYSTSLSGYTQDGYSLVQSGSGTIDYVPSFPSGFSTSNYYYQTYNKTPVSASESSTQKTTVSTSTIGYLYWHWCRGDNAGAINRYIWSYPTSNSYGNFYTFHAAFRSSALGNPIYSDGYCYQWANTSACNSTYWWFGGNQYSTNQTAVQRCNYTNYNKLYNYYKWSDWSDWSTTTVTSSSNTAVETRTVYKYIPYNIQSGDSDEDSGVPEGARIIEGKVNEEFAGKQATLFIYKVDNASDYTNEYIGQTVIGDDGSYSFTVMLREEPTVETGDFTVVLNLEGSVAPAYLDKIEAPKKEYTVTFYDYDYSNYDPDDINSQPERVVISTQTVKEGEDAALPNDKLLGRQGYTFSNWSVTTTNVHSNLEVQAEYEVNKYTVVFVDWSAKTVNVETFNHGDILIAPKPENVDEGTLVQWDAIADGVTNVTSDMVICTEYTTRKCNVTVTDFEGNVVEEKTVNYGDYVNLPEFAESDYDSYQLIGWTNEHSDEIGVDEEISSAQELLANCIITDNCYLCPVYEYKETVEPPQASVASGEYTEAQTIELTCDTKDALIYYTLDGSDPTESKGILYTEPITITDKTILSYYATAIEKNNSSIYKNYYVINPVDSSSKWMLSSDLPDEVTNNPDDYFVSESTGYSYKIIKSTSSKSELEALINDGWTVIDHTDSEDSDYYDEPYIDDDLLGLKNSSVDIYGPGYQCSHFKYTVDGVTYVCKDSSFAPEGVEGTVEYATAESFGSIAGFDDDGNTYYLYNGERWYKRTSTQIVIGQKYYYTYQTANLYKWTDYSVDIPAEDETREYKTDKVYSYELVKNYIVNIHSIYSNQNTGIYKLGSKLSAPESIKGYKFEGYYKDIDLTDEWSLDTDTVTECIDLYAKYTPEIYTVTFAFTDGTEIETQNVDYASSAVEPEIPEIDGYVFVKWDTDEYLNVTDDITVKAIYVKESEYSTVTLNKSTVSLIEGTNITLTPYFTNESSDLTLTWTSSDNNIATVDNNGNVYAVAEGTAIITATINGVSEKAECIVNVTRDTINKLTLTSDSSLDIDTITSTLRLIKPSNNTADEIIQNFANNDIVITDSEGLTLSDDERVGTNCIISLMIDGKVADQIIAVMSADISGDGKINLKDASLMSRYFIDDFSDPTDYQIYAMDVNGDGMANNKDAALVLQYLVGKANIY